ncbi:polar amino acid transport system substrate-binding protein [Anaerosolibacter carboniphilus]|uniref:Polar amino acid transport system substrate-binding protein n=1 Tax=Anaerosolibacter carboniphilus TaxID=1417629 RepID=A0A841L8A3_9FIRM|nr:amino acid ABC transporter substrate-binding protein [Anaerosolibacter carboniphilus]MBB6218619.1 polar amino acid transport system substrate-binding protein [Anaerosolibacter carboniphilus]
MKKRMVKTMMILLIFMLGALTLTGCGEKAASAEDAYGKLKERGYVIVGLDDTFAPMGFRDENQELVGFDVDLAKAVFERVGLEVKFQPIDWSMKETELNSGNIDLIWNGYTITEERKEKVAFTKPYLENRQVIVVLGDSKINSKKDLEGKKVAVQNGSSSYDAVNKEPDLVASFAGGEPIGFDTNNEAFMDLEAGRSDAVVADEILARYYIQERGIDKYKVLGDDFGREEYGIGLRKKDVELLEKIEGALDDMKKDNTSSQISEKWFGENIVK